MFLGGELHFLDAEASNDFEREEWLLLVSTFFIWLDVFSCVLNALIPIFPSWNGFVWHILQQNGFPPAFPEIHKDISGYLFFISHSLVQYVCLDILISYLKRKILTYETDKELFCAL